MLKGKTTSGFKFQIDETVANDMELMEELAKANTDTTVFPSVLERILGADQKKALYDHLRTEDGRVPIDVCINEFAEIMTLAGEATKNS